MVVLIGLLVLTIVLFGIDATDGPLQVALFASALVAGLVALKNGHTSAAISEAAIGGVSLGDGRDLHPARRRRADRHVEHGRHDPDRRRPTASSCCGRRSSSPPSRSICALVGMVTGSSWTTAGTLGVAFIGMAPILGVSTTIAAGAIISGAYMGDKMSPLSETTVLVPEPRRRRHRQRAHPGDDRGRSSRRSCSPSLVFLVLGLAEDPSARGRHRGGPGRARRGRSTSRRSTCCRSSCWSCWRSSRCRRSSPSSARRCSPASWPSFTQPDVVEAFVDEPGPGRRAQRHRGDLPGDGQRLRVDERQRDDRRRCSRGGGMASMLTTVWLILGALSFAAIMEHAGLLDRLIAPARRRGHSRRRPDHRRWRGPASGSTSSPATSTSPTCCRAGCYRDRVRPAGLAPRMLSRTVEDTGTVTSPLVPWNSCGAYMTGVLGVSTLQYLPWAFFNYFNPLVALGLRAHRVPRRARRPSTRRARLRVPPERSTRRDEDSPMPRPQCATADLRTADRPASPTPPSRTAPSEPTARFTLPSAYTILFALIVDHRAGDVDHPGRPLRPRPRGLADPRHVPGGRVEPGAHPRRLAQGADQRPVRHRGSRPPATSTSATAATLFGAIDVALFILVIGGFIGITMKTGAIQAGIARLVGRAARPRALDDPDPDDGLRHRRDDVRHGGGEPRLLRARSSR